MAPALQKHDWRDYFFAAFLAAHTAFILAESLALAAGLILPLAFLAAGAAAAFAAGAAPRTLAQRNLAAAEILALAAALILNFLFFGAGPATEAADEPSSWPSSFSRDWIFSFNVAAVRNC